MRYCPDCGTGHDCEAETGGRTDPAVEIARINADRDVAVARLAARSAREELATVEEVAGIQADAEVEAAVAEAEIIGDAIEAGIEPEPEPLIIEAPEPGGDELDGDAPPELEGSPPPAPAGKRKLGLGAW